MSRPCTMAGDLRWNWRAMSYTAAEILNFVFARIGILGVCSEPSHAKGYVLGGVVLRMFNRLGKLSRRRKLADV